MEPINTLFLWGAEQVASAQHVLALSKRSLMLHISEYNKPRKAHKEPSRGKIKTLSNLPRFLSHLGGPQLGVGGGEREKICSVLGISR